MVGSTRWTAFRLAKPRPLGGTAPSIWLNHPIYWGLPGLQALHAHTKYTAGVQLCVGISVHPNSQIGVVYAHAEAIQALWWWWGAAPIRTLLQGRDTPLVHPPCVHFSAGGAPKKHSPKSALRIWWFSHIWTFSWENCPFSSKWNRLWRLKASFAIKGLTGVVHKVWPWQWLIISLHRYITAHFHCTCNVLSSFQTDWPSDLRL